LEESQAMLFYFVFKASSPVQPIRFIWLWNWFYNGAI